MTARRPAQLAVFDTETTGVDFERDRIVTAFIGLMEPNTGEWTEKWSWLLDPEMEIPEEASAVHGISTEQARENGANWANGIFAIAQRLDIIQRTDTPIVVYNAPFDFTMLDRNLRESYPGIRPFEPKLVLDPLVIDKRLDKYRKGSRKLVDVAPLYGVPARPDAHDAEADCWMAGMVAWRMLQHPKLAILNAAEIHARQVELKREQDAGFLEYKIKQTLREIPDRTEREAAQNKLRADITGHWPMRPYEEGF